MNANQLSWASLPCRALPHKTTQQIFGEAQVCSTKVQGCELAFIAPPCSWDPNLLHFVVTTAKTASILHIPSEPLVAGGHKVLSFWFLCRLEEEALRTLQEPPGLLMSHVDWWHWSATLTLVPLSPAPTCVLLFFHLNHLSWPRSTAEL